MMPQISVQKAICDNCHCFVAGTPGATEGFLCENCIRLLIIKHQLWNYAGPFRETRIRELITIHYQARSQKRVA